MKSTIKSLLILGLLSNFSSLFSNDTELSKNIYMQSIQSYKQFSTAEQSKRKFRYCTGVLGLVGIGGLVYYSWKSDTRNRGTEHDLSDVLSTVGALKKEVQALRAPAVPAVPVASWSAAAKEYIVGTIKNSFFGATTIGTAMVMTAVQGYGASIFAKGVLNPLGEKFIAIYSINRFMSTKTKMNQNIKDLIKSLAALKKDNTENSNIEKNFLKQHLACWKEIW